MQAADPVIYASWSMLATLQDQFGFGAKDAHDIEREARAVRAPAISVHSP